MTEHCSRIILLTFSAIISVCGIFIFHILVLGATRNQQNEGSVSGFRASRRIARRPTNQNNLPNNLNAIRIALGKELYFDKRLSADHTVSCATCHDPAAAFASKDVVAIGVQNRVGTRNVPTLLNARFSMSYFWDGRARTLEDQARQPLLNPSEMGMISEAALVKRLSSIPDYRKQFRRVFRGEGITLNTVVKAIAAYERTLVSRNSPFDRFIAGDRNAITDAQHKGWELFKGKAKCIQCHTVTPSLRLFTDFKFYNTGIAAGAQNFEEMIRRAEDIRLRRGLERVDPGLLAHRPEFSDLGRFLVSNELKDVGAFKTPTIRDVELTGPYMHNGSLKTLLDVVRFYNQGGTKNPYLDNKMLPLNLDEQEMSDVVEFLRALSSDDVLRQAQYAKPQNRERFSASKRRR